MDLRLDTSLVEIYSSLSQKIRIETENWVAENLYSPVCGFPHIQLPGNTIMKITKYAVALSNFECIKILAQSDPDIFIPTALIFLEILQCCTRQMPCVPRKR